MGQHKNQHYVPKFYLKLFSNKEGRSVSLFNIKRRIMFLRASISDQCSQNFFYGKDEATEKLLEKMEGMTAKVLHKVIQTNFVPIKCSDEFVTLVCYTVIQRFRTKSAAEWIDELTDMICKASLQTDPEITPDHLSKYKIKTKMPSLVSSVVGADCSPLALDLDLKLIVNSSAEQFITSDNPVIFYNQYLEHSRGGTCSGLAAQGLQIFLPITPSLMIHFYDPDIYEVGSKRSLFCETCSDAETLKFNQLQWLNALENVYFSLSCSSDSIQGQAEKFLKPDQPLIATKPGGQSLDNLDLKIRLKPSFVRIRKRRKKLPVALRVPQVRNIDYIQALHHFRNESKGSKSSFNDLLTYVRPGNAEAGISF